MTPQNIWCVGRNYADHAKEMGYQQALSEPLVFLKAGSCLVKSGGTLRLPPWSQDIQHEVEVTFRFGSDLRIDAFTIGLDLTARDQQSKAKKEGQPWTLAKSFRDACALAEWQDLGAIDPQNLAFQLLVNGEVRQRGHTRDMVYSVAQLASYVGERFPVLPGDALMTGTPAGVSPLKPGDILRADILGQVSAEWAVAR